MVQTSLPQSSFANIVDDGILFWKKKDNWKNVTLSSLRTWENVFFFFFVSQTGNTQVALG